MFERQVLVVMVDHNGLEVGDLIVSHSKFYTTESMWYGSTNDNLYIDKCFETNKVESLGDL